MHRPKRGAPSWLSSAVFYQVYPQSFFDANDDGIGDLEGIRRKLDYLQWLGCNAIWINPCFVSPFQDAGYDVADFCRVAPRYGTNADMKRLFREARARGMRVCLDLVAGHTSVEHPWFKASARPARNRYSDWFIWTKTIRERALDGLTPISGYSERAANYLANFFYFQPSLNYGFADPQATWQLPCHHAAVLALRAEMKRIMRFWLDMGADGFRVDMAFSLVKSDPAAEATAAWWREVREMFDRHYPHAVLMSEWGYPTRAIGAGFHVDFWLAFFLPGYLELFRREPRRALTRDTPGHSFFDRSGQGDVTVFLQNYLDQHRATATDGFIAMPVGNHDVSRISLGRTPRELAVIFAFVLTMPGVPFIYYGDEIGMRYDARVPSKEGGYHRTGSRTPMQWTKGPNAGFSRAPARRLYLPVDRRKDRPTVEEQQRSPRSLLNTVRDLVELRRAHPALQAAGEFIPLHARPHACPFVYLRRLGDESYLVALNPSGSPVKTVIAPCGDSMPEHHADMALEMGTRGVALEACTPGRFELTMPPVSFGVFRVDKK